MLILRRIPQKNDCTQGAAEASKMHFCKLLKIRCRFLRKIQGTYFKISALYFKIYGLYFLQDALCFFGHAFGIKKCGIILFPCAHVYGRIADIIPPKLYPKWSAMHNLWRTAVLPVVGMRRNLKQALWQVPHSAFPLLYLWCAFWRC